MMTGRKQLPPQFDAFVKRVLAYRPPVNEPVKASPKAHQSKRRSKPGA